MRVVFFALVVLSVHLASMVYVGTRAAAAVSPRWVPIVWVLAGLYGLSVPLSFWVLRTVRSGQPDTWVHLLMWSAYLGMGVFSLLFVGFFAADLIAWMAKFVAPPVNPERRAVLLHGVYGGVMAFTGVASLLGWRAARRRPRVVEVNVPIDGLDGALEGLCIVQLTDIHVGPTIRGDWVKQIVDHVNTLDADLVCITGDLVDGSVRALRDHVAPLAELQSRHGTFFVAGNHEYYSGVDAWLAECRRLGMTTLTNEHTTLEHEGARMVVAGVTDHSAHRMRPDHQSDPEAAIDGAPENTMRLLLAHQPRSGWAAGAVRRLDGGPAFSLQLSGHTHGGQYFPWSFLVRFIQPFAVGLHRHKDMWIYTSSGTGYWGPPNRLGVPAEITKITLVSS